MALDDSQAKDDWATVTTNNAAADPSSAWAAALSGVALGVYVDRTLNAPQTISSSIGYGINPDGSVYQLGKPTLQVSAVPVAKNNNLLLLLIVAAVVFAESK